MLVRKCDVCNHIMEDEVGYMVDIYKITMPRGTEVRTKSHDTTIEICYDCKQAMCGVLNKRMTECVLMGKVQENENV